MLNKTIPERVFQVKDASGRQYKVTRYAWMESEADEAWSRSKARPLRNPPERGACPPHGTSTSTVGRA
mgnify:CR=1 FL=1